jgi:hypothetical protein
VAVGNSGGEGLRSNCTKREVNQGPATLQGARREQRGSLRLAGHLRSAMAALVSWHQQQGQGSAGSRAAVEARAAVRHGMAAPTTQGKRGKSKRH